MNRKIGMAGSLICGISVVLFAVFMLAAFNFGSYFVCMFLAIGFVLMIGTFAHECEPDRKAAANAAAVFAGVYCVIILLVYFAQTTSVRLDGLNEQATRIMDYSKSGLYFNYDLLGYGMMALSTFWIGLTIPGNGNADKWLKRLLLLHGIFFLPCLVVPMLGIFSSGDYWAGVIALEFWCAYFTPVCVLSYLHFMKRS